VISIRAIEADQWQEWRAMRLAALAEAAYAFGSTLEEWSGAGDTEGRWRGRLLSVPVNLIADLGGRPVGMASGTAPVQGEVELISMWVAPEGRGSGVGDALVEAIARWTSGQGAHRLVLAVRQANRRAIAFYERQGFRDVGSASAVGDPFPERRMMLTALR
jgi:ribosomal protein S18 acetylase RimI-like enzyme